MTFSVPRELKHWVDAQVRERGYDSAGEYVRDMLRRARERDSRRKVDLMLVEAIEAGANVVMDDADWKSIRRDARTAAAKSSGEKR